MADAPVHDFDSSAEIGKCGEECFTFLMLARGDVSKIDDVRDIPEFRLEDIDFIVHYKDGRVESHSVKIDWKTYETGNIFLEWVSVFRSWRHGWVRTTAADKVSYITPQDGVMYVMCASWLKNYAKRLDRMPEIKKVVQKARTKRGNRPYSSIGFLVPVDILMRKMQSKLLEVYMRRSIDYDIESDSKRISHFRLAHDKTNQKSTGKTT